jgi:hypothetical protein
MSATAAVESEATIPTHTMGKKHLPQPRGPHSVGFVDVMTPGKCFFVSFYEFKTFKVGTEYRLDAWYNGTSQNKLVLIIVVPNKVDCSGKSRIK